MDNEFISLTKCKLMRKLAPSRYEHTIGVAYTAAALAMRYNINMEDAYVAGLLHDCAKQLTEEKLLEKSEFYGIPISEDEHNNPFLLHGKVGAYIARDKYGVRNQEILNAIACHTKGCVDMSMMDMIIYVSDFIEPNRDKAPNLDYFRHLAFVDIKRCTLEIMEQTISHVRSRFGSVSADTLYIYEDLKQKIGGENGSKTTG